MSSQVSSQAPAISKKMLFESQTLRYMPRIAIESITPAIDGGRFAVKRILGDTLEVEADIIMDGHDKLGVNVLWREPHQETWQRFAMQEAGNSRWRASIPAMQQIGRHLFQIEAWYDRFSTYRDELEKKIIAGLDVTLELEEGRLLIEKMHVYHAIGKKNEAASLEVNGPEVDGLEVDALKAAETPSPDTPGKSAKQAKLNSNKKLTSQLNQLLKEIAKP